MYVATGVLTGCELADAASGSGCEGTGSRVDELKAYGVLDARPQGPVVPKGFENLDADCREDSGEAWLHAERTYVFPGDKAEVTRFGDKDDSTILDVCFLSPAAR